MKEIIIKKADKNIKKELRSIGFDEQYIDTAVNKYKGKALKIFKLKTPAANILKQSCLSLGFDCAVSRNTITCKDEYTDCLMFVTPDKIKKLAEKIKNQPFGLSDLAKILINKQENPLLPLKLEHKTFDWSKPYIMGILNVTPDSFSDGGRYLDADSALKHCEEMISEGADFIDIGGESTRPGACPVSFNEEINRVVPVIEKIRKSGINIPISVDTRNFETAKAAIGAGADIINDVSGMKNEKLLEYVCENNIPCVVMHSDTVPAVGADFTNGDIVEEIYVSLFEKAKELESHGLSKSNIIIDPGIGFGKSAEAGFEILRRIDEFASLGYPILSGISRKSFIRNTFNADFDEADAVTALYSAMCKNVNIHRVHNVSKTAAFLKYAAMI